MGHKKKEHIIKEDTTKSQKRDKKRKMNYTKNKKEHLWERI